MKMPLARAKAAEASFPTLVDEGSEFFRIRRTQASGGSNSMAEGGPPDPTAVALELFSLLLADASAAASVLEVPVMISDYLLYLYFFRFT